MKKGRELADAGVLPLQLLEELVVSEVATRAGGADREAKDLFISEDWNGVNTGVFILRNSSWSRWFLQEAWGSKVRSPGLSVLNIQA